MALRALTPNTVTSPTMAPSDRPPPIEAMAATLPIRLKGRLTSTSQVWARQWKAEEQDQADQHQREGACKKQHLRLGGCCACGRAAEFDIDAGAQLERRHPRLGLIDRRPAATGPRH